MTGAITLLVMMVLVLWFLAVKRFLFYCGQKDKLLATLGVAGQNKVPRTFKERIIILLVRLGRKFAPVGARCTVLIKKVYLSRNLALAGNSYGLDIASFLGICFVMGVSGLLMGNLLVLLGFPLGRLLQFVFLLLGFAGPIYGLRAAAHKRQEEIGLALPNYLDAISVTLQAGVSLESAMRYTIMQTKGPLGEELDIWQNEIELGLPREEAYNRLRQRNNCPQLATLVYALNQGSKLGVPVATTFKVLAEDMRINRINTLKEKAGQASPKVTLITSFIILPAVLIGIFGLLVLNLFYNPQGLGLQGLYFN